MLFNLCQVKAQKLKYILKDINYPIVIRGTSDSKKKECDFTLVFVLTPILCLIAYKAYL